MDEWRCDCVVVDGYQLVYYRNDNQIIISLPQTIQTIGTTSLSIVKRKVDLTREELAMLLNMIKYFCEDDMEVDDD